MDHAFENLGPDRFQQLVQSVLKSAFPKTVCFPVGQPDGGRDSMERASSDEEGFLVYQVKYSKNPQAVQDASKWLLDKFDGEAQKIHELIARGATEYILITNVAGTSHLGGGSIDRAFEELNSQFKIPIQCWWRDDLNRRLDGIWDIKLRYPEVMSGHDFFRILVETTKGQDQSRRMNCLRAFLTDQYEEDVDVKFKQIELHNKLLDLFIDLPFRVVVRRVPTMNAVQRTRYRARMTPDRHIAVSSLDIDGDINQGSASFLLDDWDSLVNQIVVEGAPGQGKSTLAQYLCQVHRIRILQKTSELALLPDAHRSSPLRIPFKVDLRDLGAWLTGFDPFAATQSEAPLHQPRSLETFLAKLVSHHSGGNEFNVNDLLEISKTTPLLIVLDGLDEVVDIKQRTEVISAITKAAPRLREICPLLSIIVTSRPAAFANSPGFDLQNFPHLQLLSVGRSQISAYAKRWMDVRRLTPREQSEFTSILSEKLDAPHMRDLARNPMQLAILLSLILTQGAALPDKRTSLYDAYVDLFFSRESAKSAAVRKHIDLLKELHGFLGWTIHSRAETDKKTSNGRITDDDLRKLLSYYLAEEEHGMDVIDEVFNAMLERVVMIVSRIEGTYEFEVQPLREYFAARYLYDTSSYSPPGRETKGTKPDRFDAIARNFYWLNVVRFFCGCFSKGELLDLADRVRELINDPILGKSRHSITLGAMLLSDWVFAQSPKATAQIVEKLVSSDSFRRLAPKINNFPDGQAITLPGKSGGVALFQTGFELLESRALQADQMQQIAHVVSQQASPEEVERRWLSSTLPPDKNVRWLEIGYALDTLQTAPISEILTRVGRSSGRENLAIFVKAGRYDCVLTSDHHAALLQHHLLSRADPFYSTALNEWPLFFVPVILGNSRYLDLNLNRNSFLDVGNSLEEKRDSISGQPEFVQNCFSLSLDLLEVLKEPNGRIRSRKHDELLEKCRSFWGMRPAILNAVFSYVDQRRVSATHLPFDFFDPKAQIVRRVRAAKARRSNVEWWKLQLSNAKSVSPQNRMLLLLAHFKEASLRVISECGALTNQLLAEQRKEEWLMLSSVLGGLLEEQESERPEGAIDFWNGLVSPRLRYLLALRYPAILGQKYFMEDCLGKPEEDICTPQFRQMWALKSHLSGSLDWTITLTIVRETYAKGAHGFANYSLRQDSVPMPPHVANEILSNPDRYPVGLWEIAERAATVSARKAVRAVGAVAKVDRWFSH